MNKNVIQNRIYEDNHLHTNFSSDCKSDPEKVIETAIKKGLTGLCITDHNDLDFPDVPDLMKFDLDMDSYLPKMDELSNKIKEGYFDSFAPDIYTSKPSEYFKLKTGVEQGLMRSTCEKLKDFSSRYSGIDFIICSSHLVGNEDPYYIQTFQNPDGSYKDPMTVFKSYFEDELYVVSNFTDYSVYGHIDYVCRYGPEKITSEVFETKYYPQLKDLFEEILKNIIKNGKGIEINTGSLYRGMDFTHPHPLTLKMFRDLGGEIITFGSDAHDYEHIGHAIEDAKELARYYGFKYFCTFKNMKPEFHSL